MSSNISATQRKAMARNAEYHNLKAHGICPMGCGNDPAPGRTLCNPCLGGQLNRTREWLEQCRRLGICQYCQKAARPGLLTCSNCKDAAYQAVKRRSAERNAKGLCARCGKEPRKSADHKYGARCLARQNKRTRLKTAKGITQNAIN